MKTKKSIITAAILIFCYSFSDAQLYLTPSQSLEAHKKEIGSTQYIFEGTVIQQNKYDGEKQIVTTCIVQITKIFKGWPQLKLGSIKLVTMQYMKYDSGVVILSDGGYTVPIGKGGTYIIFARLANSDWSVDSTSTDNTTTLTSWYGLDYPIVISANDTVYWYDTPQFKTKEDIYSFFQANGLTVQAQATAADSAKYKKVMFTDEVRVNTIQSKPVPPKPAPAPPAPITVDTTKIYTKVQSTPLFRGNIKTYLTNNVKYPDSARVKNIQGIVWVNFVVERNGSISNVSILRSRDKSLNAEAERVIANMPNWKPGRLNGVAVRTQYMIPVSFKLQ